LDTPKASSPASLLGGSGKTISILNFDMFQSEEDTMMTYQHVRVGLVAVMLVLAGPLDPDCSAAKAARGAATKAVVGVRGNRCDVAETTRDTLGIDDRGRKKQDDDGVVKRVRKD
jgi:hypothetical protein